jgi:hypothetical protein
MSEWTSYHVSPKLDYINTPDGNRLWRSQTGDIAIELRTQEDRDFDAAAHIAIPATDQTPPPETEKPKRRRSKKT